MSSGVRSWPVLRSSSCNFVEIAGLDDLLEGGTDLPIGLPEQAKTAQIGFVDLVGFVECHQSVGNRQQSFLFAGARIR